MTECALHPKAKVRHTAVLIEWGTNAVMVQHYCPEGYDQDPCEGRGHQWLEDAKDEKAVLAKVGLFRIEAEHHAECMIHDTLESKTWFCHKACPVKLPSADEAGVPK